MNDEFNPYAAPQSATLSAPAHDGELPLASRWHRLGAVIIDTLILMAILLPLQWLFGTFQRNIALATKGGGLFAAFTMENFLWAVIGSAIMIGVNWTHLIRGQTIGKGLLNIRVSNLDGTTADRKQIILMRILPSQIAAHLPVINLLFGIVDLFMIFRSDKRMLHDMIAGTKVVDLRSQRG